MWDLFRRTPSQVGLGRCAAVVLAVCVSWNAAIFRFTFGHFPANAHALRQVSGSLASFTSLLVLRRGAASQGVIPRSPTSIFAAYLSPWACRLVLQRALANKTGS